MSKVIIGTELKLNVNIQPIDGITMASYDFDVIRKGGKQSVTLSKKGDTLTDGLRQGDDENNYIVAFNTEDLGLGRVVCRVVAYIPDGDFNLQDRKITEITEVNTGIEVVKSLV